MKFLTVLAAVLALLGGCVRVQPGSTAPVAGTLPMTAPVSGSFDTMLNQARATAGLGSVTSSAKLDAIAQAHANDMVTRNYFSHTTPEGVSFSARLNAAGVRACAAAENIANGQSTAAGVMNSWMGSAGHRANILNTGVTSYGLGRAGRYWVLLMARPC